jgi:hypothetical protein
VTTEDIEQVCYTGNCDVNYYFTYTPLLYDTVPNQIYEGLKAQVVINTRSVYSFLEDDMDPLQEIKIGTTRQDYEGLIDAGWDLSWWRADWFPFYVSDQKPGNSEIWPLFRVGHSFKMGQSRHCTWDMSDCWTVKTHPVVSGISASEGYTSGY